MNIEQIFSLRSLYFQHFPTKRTAIRRAMGSCVGREGDSTESTTAGSVLPGLRQEVKQATTPGPKGKPTRRAASWRAVKRRSSSVRRAMRREAKSSPAAR